MPNLNTGELIDPYGGRQDLRDHVFRHVSSAFNEDPLRCYRVARFAAKLPAFEIQSETLDLLKTMQPQLVELSAERVWNEWVKALQQPKPHRFYEVVRDAEIISPWFQELDLENLIETHKHKNLTLPAAFALLGWFHTDKALRSLFDRLIAPNKTRNMADAVRQHGRLLEQFTTLDAESAIDLLEQTRAFHRNSQFDHVIQALSEFREFDALAVQEIRARLSTVKGDGASGPSLWGIAPSKPRQGLNASPSEILTFRFVTLTLLALRN